MNCDDMKNDVLADYADRQLAIEDRARVKRHLDECDRCRNRRGDVETMAAALWHAAEAPPAALVRQLDIAVLALPSRRRRAWPILLAAAFTGAAAGVLITFIALTRPAPDPSAPTVAIVAPVPPPPPLPLSPPALAGDLNGDGTVDVADARVILRRVATGEPAPANADVNGDGAVDIADAREITRSGVKAP